MRLPVLHGPSAPTLPQAQAQGKRRLRDVIADSSFGGVHASSGGPAHVLDRLTGDVADAGGASYPRSPVWDALREVMDPELPVSVVDLGLIVAVRRSDARVDVDLTFTAIGCPCMAFIKQDVEERLLDVPGVEAVTIHEVWTPAWTRARMTAEGRRALKLAGVAT
ncbi:MAG: metal-sulfur cluster assembly factor [Longimicrobiales bacterium]